VSDTIRTPPSPITTITPPAWKLRAATVVGEPYVLMHGAGALSDVAAHTARSGTSELGVLIVEYHVQPASSLRMSPRKSNNSSCTAIRTSLISMVFEIPSVKFENLLVRL
jgi:hypothetical protein